MSGVQVFSCLLYARLCLCCTVVSACAVRSSLLVLYGRLCLYVSFVSFLLGQCLIGRLEGGRTVGKQAGVSQARTSSWGVFEGRDGLDGLDGDGMRRWLMAGWSLSYESSSFFLSSLPYVA